MNECQWADSQIWQEIRPKIEEGYANGFIYMPKFINVSHTALDVANQYFYSKQNNLLTKENEATYNNRWLQFRGPFIEKTKGVVEKTNRMLGTTNAHIYANWIKDGHHYGRHKDDMDVVIVQVWNKVAYCCESPYGGKMHHSYVLEPGDAIYIRAQTWHTPIIFGERMSISFSWG